MSWEILDENTLNKIKKQKEFEDKTAKSLMPLYEAAKNPLIKTMIHSIILDTTKHSETYQMLIDLNSTALIGEESKELGKTEITRHLTEEAVMLKQTEEISKVVQNKQVKQVILNILDDERKHHRVLAELIKMLEKESSEWNAYLYDLIEGFP